METSQSPVMILCYLVVGMLWGCTNPFIKNAQSKKYDLNSSNKKTIYYTLKNFVTDPLLFLPFILNQRFAIHFSSNFSLKVNLFVLFIYIVVALYFII